MRTIADYEANATETRIKQLASAVSLSANEASSPDDFRIRVYEATCDALKHIRAESLESAAKKLDSFHDGSILAGGDGHIAGRSAAAMVRALKDILSRG